MKIKCFSLFAITAFLSVNSFSQKVTPVQFSNADSSVSGCGFLYSDYRSSAYLDSLRRTFEIDKVVKGCSSDFEKVLALLEWTSNQWKHNGWNEPKKGDAISILYEVRNGQNFRCVEYGIVLAATLNSIGISARSIGLKTKDVETTKSGAGHVATEAFLNDLSKWIFIDPQYGIAPTLKGMPLNAVEFNRALCDNLTTIKYINHKGEISGSAAKRYSKWIAPYLFYFDAAMDNRYKVEKFDRLRCNGKKVLMLVPLGAKNPEVFQISTKLNWCTYTNNIDLFYAPPVVEKIQ
ncbi:MAG TPA: hypothetical protein DIW31_00685 [Bacteroidales bacterium]|nr:hypothetical protein [Bacteroidales bacterium]